MLSKRVRTGAAIKLSRARFLGRCHDAEASCRIVSAAPACTERSRRARSPPLPVGRRSSRFAPRMEIAERFIGLLDSDEYLDDGHLERLRDYRYSTVDLSPTTKYVLRHCT